jgi:Domain of unknown function (DUF4189)
MYKIVSILFAIIGLFAAAPDAQASQICENVVTGQTPAPIIGSDTNNNPIYGSPQPIYEQQCTWKYGAIAIDPKTRMYVAAWNYDDTQAAQDKVVGDCGSQCVWINFKDDFAYIALSDDDTISGVSVKNSADAEMQCTLAGGVKCSTILNASSTSDATYWKFGAVAYDVTTGQSAAAWGHNRKSQAEQEALKSCGLAGCWAYTFQTGYGAIAMADDGILYGSWSARDEESAGKVAEKSCEKDKGKKSCSVVATGSSAFEPTFKLKPVKSKSKKG